MRLRTWLPGLLFLAAGTGAVYLIVGLEGRMERAERTIRSLVQMHERAYATIEGRVYYQQPGETREAWVQRVLRITTGQEELAEYLCDDLTGCSVPGGTITVCTPCNSSPPSPQCVANHQADLDAFCKAFNCDQCR